MKASDLLIQALENEGVTHIFGIPGEENLDMVESLRSSKIKLVLTRHEQGAAFMAAKCQQNQFFTEKGSDYSTYGNQIPYVPNAYRQYFKIIKDYYADTQFFSEVVQECLYYEMYALRN